MVSSAPADPEAVERSPTMPDATTLPPGPLPAPPEAGDSLYEVVDGRYVEPPPMGALEVHLANLLTFALTQFAREHRLGRVEMEMLFLLDGAKNLQRRPDIAFVS